MSDLLESRPVGEFQDPAVRPKGEPKPARRPLTKNPRTKPIPAPWPDDPKPPAKMIIPPRPEQDDLGRRNFWTDFPSRDDCIRAYARAGLSAATCARLIGVSADAVRCRGGRLGVSFRALAHFADPKSFGGMHNAQSQADERRAILSLQRDERRVKLP